MAKLSRTKTSLVFSRRFSRRSSLAIPLNRADRAKEAHSAPSFLRSFFKVFLHSTARPTQTVFVVDLKPFYLL